MRGAVLHSAKAAGIIVYQHWAIRFYAVACRRGLLQPAGEADRHRLRERRLAGDRFLVVGIGTSAGGIEALQGFLAPMPPDPGMAFIVVTHLGEGHKSALPEILARMTGLPVVAARDGAAIEPNRVYVLSSDAAPLLRRKRLRLVNQEAARRQRNTTDGVFPS